MIESSCTDDRVALVLMIGSSRTAPDGLMIEVFPVQILSLVPNLEIVRVTCDFFRSKLHKYINKEFRMSSVEQMFPRSSGLTVFIRIFLNKEKIVKVLQKF